MSLMGFCRPQNTTRFPACSRPFAPLRSERTLAGSSCPARLFGDLCTRQKRRSTSITHRICICVGPLDLLWDCLWREGTTFSARSHYPRPAALCRHVALGARPLCYNSAAEDTCLSSKRRPLKTSRRLPDAHSGRLPPQQEFGCSDYASICPGIIVCMLAFNISGILLPPASPRPPFF